MVIVDRSLSPTAQIDATDSPQVSLPSSKKFKRLTLLSLHSPLIRSPEYRVQAWILYVIHDIIKLEKVLEVTVKGVPGTSHLSYPERLKILKRCSFRRRRLRVELMETVIWSTTLCRLTQLSK